MEKIMKLISRLSKSQIKHSKELMQSAKENINKHNYKDALKELTKAIEEYPLNIDALFNMGIVQLNLNNPKRAAEYLQRVIDINPTYHKACYLLLAISYHKMDNVEEALNILSKTISKYPKYVDVYCARAKIYENLKEHQKAIDDFLLVTKLFPRFGPAFISLGDCYCTIGNISLAEEMYENAINILGTEESLRRDIYLKRAEMFLTNKMLEKALSDFDKASELNENPNPELIMKKAKITRKLNKPQNALILFEQVIKHDKSNELAKKALFKIVCMRMEERDFYGAYFNLKRLMKYKDLSSKIMQYYTLVEGIVFLMKRKTKKGIKLLTGFAQNLNLVNKQVQQMCFIYRAYAKMTMHMFKEALDDYKTAESILALDDTSLFNKTLCESILILLENNYSDAFKHLEKARQILPESRVSHFYKCIFHFYEFLNQKDNLTVENYMITQADIEMDKALEIAPKDSELQFYKGVILIVQKQYSEALKRLNRAIEYADESLARHYVIRGLCYGCMSMFKEGIEDLSIAIKLDPFYTDAYFLKGTSSYLLGDSTESFTAFQQMIQCNEKNPLLHVHAGNLLMTAGCFDDAAKAFTNSNNIIENDLAYYQKSKCAINKCDPNEALVCIKKALKFGTTKHSCLIQRDHVILSFLNKLILNSSDDQMKKQFLEILKEALSSQTNVSFDEVEVTQFDYNSDDGCIQYKARKDENGQKDNKVIKKPTGLQQQVKNNYCKIAVEKIYKTPLFNKEDILAYSGVMELYIGDPKKALEYFNNVSEIMCQQSEKLLELEEDGSSTYALNEIADFQLCSMSINECAYNILLSEIRCENYKAGLEICQKLITSSSVASAEELNKLKELLVKAVNNDENQIDLNDPKKEIGKTSTEGKKILNIFKCENPLAQCLSYLEIKIMNIIVKMRPVIGFPFIRPINMIPSSGLYILREFHPRVVPSQPEAPWIKKCEYGIKFTDVIENIPGGPIVFEDAADRKEEKQSDIQSQSSSSNVIDNSEPEGNENHPNESAQSSNIKTDSSVDDENNLR